MPLVTLWFGPTLGILAPVLAAWIIGRSWAWFIAYFCVLANGTYLAMAWITGDSLLDTSRLLKHGAHPMTIILYCILTTSLGYRGLRQSLIELWTSPNPS